MALVTGYTVVKTIHGYRYLCGPDEAFNTCYSFENRNTNCGEPQVEHNSIANDHRTMTKMMTNEKINVAKFLSPFEWNIASQVPRTYTTYYNLQ